MILAIDMSLRSTGWCIIKFDGNLVDFGIIKTDKDEFPDDEALIVHLRDTIDMLLIDHGEIEQVVIEGLSLNSKSPKKDVIAGAYWIVRTVIWEHYAEEGITIGSVPVLSWRNWFTTLEERKDFKKNCPNHLKNVVFCKLPIDIQNKFLYYVINRGHNMKSVFDLADSYGLAQYRNHLNT